MTNYRSLAKQPRRFLALTGYTIKEFEHLLPYFRAEFECYVETHTLAGKERSKRRYSAYKNSPLPTIEDKLLFILVYLKQGVTQEVHGTLISVAVIPQARPPAMIASVLVPA